MTHLVYGSPVTLVTNHHTSIGVQVEVEYCFASHQLIYGYLETDDDNDDEIDRNSNFHFKTRDLLVLHPIPQRYGMRWTSL